jgi:hypothetical protein
MYLDGNLNASVCLLPSFLIYVSVKKLIIDGASMFMSLLNTAQVPNQQMESVFTRERPLRFFNHLELVSYVQ